ncbi:maleylpyruvate isomerase N-terminal domain-containing protein [Micromonospora sp. NPDC048935]|uniref:maleylpyruvate isomerase N-terminal domain-containing protein n=1 Tax=Micromonospora sp. NPDC048935 TaxID=3364262 RepID=UPI0037111E63
MSLTSVQSGRVRAALPVMAGRLRALASRVPPDLRATQHWTAADTLAHLCAIAAIDISLVTRAPSWLPVPGLNEARASATVDNLAGVNKIVLSQFTERNPHVLLDRLDQDLRRLLELAADPGAPATVPWLGNGTLPLDGLLAHLLNEMDIHGWDIARAARQPWHTTPQDAALFMDLFLVGIVRHGYGHLLDREGPVRPGRISVTFRSRQSEPVTMALVDGVVRVEPVDPRPDVSLTYDPVTFNRLLFHRVSYPRAVLTGKVRVGGRRPWLLPAFTETMRLPS